MPPCASNGRRRLPACLVLALLVLTRAGFISGLQPNENRDSSVADIAMPSRPSLGSLQPVLDDGQFSARELQQFDMVPLLPFSPPPSPSPSPSPSPVETSPSPVTYQAPPPSPPTEGQNTALYIALGAGIGGALLLGAAIGMLLFWLARRKRRSSAEKDVEKAGGPPSNSIVPYYGACVPQESPGSSGSGSRPPQQAQPAWSAWGRQPEAQPQTSADGGAPSPPPYPPQLPWYSPAPAGAGARATEMSPEAAQRPHTMHPNVIYSAPGTPEDQRIPTRQAVPASSSPSPPSYDWAYYARTRISPAPGGPSASASRYPSRRAGKQVVFHDDGSPRVLEVMVATRRQGTTRELLDSAAFHARPAAPAHPFFVEELDSEGEVERPARHAPAPGPRQAPRDSMDGYAAAPYFGGFTSRAGRSLELGTERGRDSVDLHVPRGTAMKAAAVVVERPHRPLAGPDHRAPAEERESPPMAAAVEEPHPPLTPIQLPGAERHAGGRTPRDPGARQSWRAHDPSSLLTPYELGQEEEGAGGAGEDEGKWAPGGERGRPMKGSAEAAWPHTELPDIATAPRKRSDDGDWRRQSFGRRDVLGSLGPWEEERPENAM
ncbi:hypothetical protein ACKKBG_A08420 [Auxenochlorella protothecoides x Auxenochlorella symbiontica]